MLTICSPGTSRHLLTAQQHLTSEVLYLLLPHVQYLRSGGARRLVMVAAITAEAKHHHTAEGLCLYKPSNDKLIVRKQRLKMSIKFQYFLCTLTKSLSVEPQRSREEDRVYVSIGDWRYTSGTALGPLKPVFPLAPGQRLLTLFAFVLMPFAGDLSGNEKHASGEISLTESLHRF